MSACLHGHTRVPRRALSPPGAVKSRGKEVGANSSGSPNALRGSSAQRGAPAPPGALPVRSRPAGRLAPALRRSPSPLSRRIQSPFSSPASRRAEPQAGSPPGRTCSRRRSGMRWGALRARASRPPQQPPGLAGSRMLRPPRAPLVVPRCPHRPHGGRLSQPEALPQGSTKAGKRARERDRRTNRHTHRETQREI